MIIEKYLNWWKRREDALMCWDECIKANPNFGIAYKYKGLNI